MRKYAHRGREREARVLISGAWFFTERGAPPASRGCMRYNPRGEGWKTEVRGNLENYMDEIYGEMYL